MFYNKQIKAHTFMFLSCYFYWRKETLWRANLRPRSLTQGRLWRRDVRYSGKSGPNFQTDPQNTCLRMGETVCSFFCFLWRCGPARAMASSFLRFLDHTQRRITVGRTPLDEWSARRRDLYLTTHNTHNRQTSMLPVRFEATISEIEWPQTYALDRAATGTGGRDSSM